MRKLSELPNIGKTLEKRLIQVGIHSESDLIETGIENVIIKIATLDRSAVCLNMVFALKGAIEGIRWHNLDDVQKNSMRDFFNQLDRHVEP